MASPSGLLTPNPSARRWPLRAATGAGLACLVAGGALLLTGPGGADFGTLPPGAAPAGALPAGTGPAGAPPEGTPPPVGAPGGTPPAGDRPGGTALEAAPAALPVPGTVPVAVEIPGRSVAAPVVPVGTAPNGAMVIPDPPSTVGWWAPGPLAGSATGAAVLAGHVDTAAAGPGALAVLREVEPGEEVVVRGADGRALRHVVTARREYPKADLPLDLFDGDGPPGLVLITCGGAFDPATGHYEDNVVVHAVPA